MRKLLTFILLVAMLMSLSVTALAETETPNATGAVRYGASDTYTVTIPEAVVINIVNKVGSGELKITDVIIGSGKMLNIKISSKNADGKDYRLVDGTKTLKYRIITTENVECDANTVALEIAAGAQKAETSLQFQLVSEPKEDGNYTDQLTFTVTIE